MWYGKYENYTNDDWGDNIPNKIKQITSEDLEKQLITQILKEELEYHFNKLLNNK